MSCTSRRSGIGKQSLDPGDFGIRHQSRLTKVSPPFGAFTGHEMARIGVVSLERSIFRAAETLRCAFICFHFWHNKLSPLIRYSFVCWLIKIGKNTSSGERRKEPVNTCVGSAHWQAAYLAGVRTIDMLRPSIFARFALQSPAHKSAVASMTF